jgi:hypothetical protein
VTAREEAWRRAAYHLLVLSWVTWFAGAAALALRPFGDWWSPIVGALASILGLIVALVGLLCLLRARRVRRSTMIVRGNRGQIRDLWISTSNPDEDGYQTFRRDAPEHRSTR